ncbi:RNA polymerase sigma-70 factor [Pedobacter sp. BS3]|uniref:RNA polymerase sigma factor n=1 Tax=Pedobacter sp. BS3 TaxID=2567937 RepID=UPI0011ED3590|nr:RNA polymerase sigma-70 factor [Pedobacter sp. BS3]TZF84909.1 RNA polymerase sigma-70 factor [Pedobacter sp. BS3]
MSAYSALTDQELVAFLCEGNEAAFTAIYNRYWAVLYAHARKMLRDDDEAMDVVQDIFTTLWKKSGGLILTTSIKSYLYTAVRNQTLNQINRSRLKDTYLLSLARFAEQGEYNTDEQVVYHDLLERIEQEIANLPPKMREIFEMSRKSGLSHKAIAEELSITDHTVKKTINRALKVLKAQISSFFTLLF